MSLTQYEPFLAQGGKIDPISEIRNAGIITAGDVRWVSDDSDAQHRVRHDRITNGAQGKSGKNFFTGIQAALDGCNAEEHDYVLILGKDANASWTGNGTAIDMNKSRVHLIGAGYGKSTRGYTTTIEGFAVADAVDNEIVHVTQEECEIAGVRILGSAGTGDAGTIDNGLLYLSGSATNLWVHDAAVEATGVQWDGETPAGLINSADDQHGLRLDNVTVGGTVTETSGSIIPVNQGAESQNWSFNNSTFFMVAGNTGRDFIIAGTGNIDHFQIDRCKFLNYDQGNVLVSAVSGNVTDDEGIVSISYCSGINVDELGTDDNAWITPAASGTLNSAYDPGVAIGTALVTAS